MGSLDADSERKNICVVSNRLPISVKLLDNGNYDFSISSGGLVGALRDLSQSLQFKWYGWPGLDIPDAKKQFVRDELAKHHAIPIFFGKELVDKHYNGFSSQYSFQHSGGVNEILRQDSMASPALSDK